MTSILRKNLTRFLSNDATVACTLHRCFFSTAKGGTLVTPPSILDSFVRKYDFSPQLASKLSPVFNRVKDSEEPDSVLSFLKENGFSNAQLEAVLRFKPGCLLAGVLEDSIKPKIRILQSLGLPPEEIAKIISCNPSILCLSQNSRLITSISILKELVGTNEAVAKLLKRSSWVLNADLEGTMVPNIEFLKSWDVPMERIFKFLYTWPRCLLLKPDAIRKSVEKVEKMGISRSSNMFIHALFVVSGSSSGTLELKLQAFRDFGFSESDTLRMFQLAPLLFTRSTKQLERVKDVILATGKYDIFCIIKCPSTLGSSVEKKYKPRFQILEILESKNLIKNWPALSVVASMSEQRFFDKFVHPYLSEVGEVYLTAQLRKQAEGAV